MKKLPLFGEPNDESLNANQEDPFGDNQIQESSPNEDNIDKNDADNGEDTEDIEDLDPLPITIVRRFFPHR